MIDGTVNNKEIISLFEYIRTISTNENGEIDIDKFKSILHSGNCDDLGVKYICSKLPEFFLRGCSVFKPYFDIALDTTKKDSNTEEELLLKLKNADFSDIKRYEQLYPYIQMISELMDDRFLTEGYIVEEELWKSGEFLPEKWKDLLSKNRKTYDEIVKSGMFSYKGSFISGHNFSFYDVYELMKNNTEDSDLIELSGIIVKCLDSSDVFHQINLEEFDNVKKGHEETLKTIQEYEDKLEELDNRLKSYGFIKSLTKRKEKEDLIKKKTKLIKDIESKKNANNLECAYIKFHEDMLEISECYKRKYAETVKETLFPKIKKVIADKYGLENPQIIDTLLDNIYNNFFTNFNDRPISNLVKEMSAVKDASFEESTAKLDNAIMTLLGMPNAAISFEKSSTKDLYSVLDIIRSELMKIPSDSDHGQLDNSFRDHEIRQDANNFMAHTSNHEHLDEIMDNLNQQFIDLMQENDIEKYIKKTGEIWYQFMLIHPYADGNGRTGRYLLNLMLAQRNLIIPALYDKQEEKEAFEHRLDRYVADRFERLPGRAQFDGKKYDFLDFDGLGEEFYNYVQDKIIDLSGKDRLNNSRPKDDDTIEETIINESGRKR